jgi:hypothetical protein
VQANTLGQGPFSKGLVAKGQIKIGGTFTSDSFDSSNPALSTNGQFDRAKRSDNGDIGSNLSSPGAVDITGKVQIYGAVATGPGGNRHHRQRDFSGRRELGRWRQYWHPKRPASQGYEYQLS